MNKIIELTRIFLLIFFRDRVTLFFSFFFNAFLLIVFGLSIDDKYDLTFDLGVVSDPKNEMVAGVLEDLENQPNTVLVHFEDETSLQENVENGKLVAGLILEDNPSNQTKDSSQYYYADGLKIKILGDESRLMWLKFLEPSLKLSIAEGNSQVKEALAATQVSTQYVESQNLRYFDFVFPGLLIFSIMQIGLSGGLTLLGLRQNENIKRLKITPLKRHEFLFGYMLSYLLILLAQAAMMMLIGMFLFNVSFLDVFWEAALIILISGITFISLGILLSNWATSPEAGDNFNRFFVFPAAFLCGVYLPINSLPSYIQKIAQMHPLTHIVEVFRGVISYSEGLNQHRISIVIVLGILTLVCFLSVVSFKWDEKAS